jgi:TorA maturation chaperone TorD
MQAPMFQVREIYRRHGLGVADWRKRSEDHLVVELLFVARLLQNAQADSLGEAARFMDEHLLRWLPQFGERVAKRCATPFYAAAAWLTAAYCDELRDCLAEIMGEPRPSAEEIEARMRPKAAQTVPVKFVPGVAPSW